MARKIQAIALVAIFIAVFVACMVAKNYTGAILSAVLLSHQLTNLCQCE